MSNVIRILSPCGILGYGFPEESFLRAFDYEIHGIVVDAGSTDAGPHKLGAGVAIVSRRATKRDLEIIIKNGIQRKIPIIIGSAGGAGAKPHVEWTLDIIKEILKEQKLRAKISVIWSDFSKEEIIKANKMGKIKPLTPNVPELTEEMIMQSENIVAQMGHEPIVEALANESDIIVCGRAYDPSPFAAIGIYHKKDPGLAYHLGKILECGALCAEPGTTKDSILGTLYEDSFTVQALNPRRICSVTSVSAHTFYEKDHPFILHGPGSYLDLSQCEFKDLGEGIVEVKNSKLVKNDKYYIKLEGARKIAYRTFVIAGIRDPILISNIEEIERKVKEQVRQYYVDVSEKDYSINFYNYGINAVLGEREPETFRGHEIGVLFEVIASSQELANSICSTVRSTFLHFDFELRKSTAGNLAFPFAPSDVEFGPVYEFSIYHLMEINEMPFKIDYFVEDWQ
jgi:hypothetical protein